MDFKKSKINLIAESFGLKKSDKIFVKRFFEAKSHQLGIRISGFLEKNWRQNAKSMRQNARWHTSRWQTSAFSENRRKALWKFDANKGRNWTLTKKIEINLTRGLALKTASLQKDYKHAVFLSCKLSPSERKNENKFLCQRRMLINEYEIIRKRTFT